MCKEKVKTLAIFIISVILVCHAVEKKLYIDELNEEISFRESREKLKNSLMEEVVLHGLALSEELAVYKSKLANAHSVVEAYETATHKVVVTMYEPVTAQTDDTPNITADGTVIKVRKASDYNYVAVSRNMLVINGGFLHYGDYVWVDAGKKSGVYQVRDTMARRWINRIDILESPGTQPYKYSDATLRRINYKNEKPSL